jgi:phosphoribosylanthranilate isomerase
MSKQEIVRWKVCDVRDFETAERCARSGADYLGLHCIWDVKPEQVSQFRKIIARLSEAYPEVGLVLVTRQTDVLAILRMEVQFGFSHIQLHAPAWTRESLVRMRAMLQDRGFESAKIIGVVALLEEPLKKIEEIKPFVDLLLLDRTSYSGVHHAEKIVPYALMKHGVECGHPVPAFIAGGLTPENVDEVLINVKPFGVDVQRGIEVTGKPGVKDPERLTSFSRAIGRIR